MSAIVRAIDHTGDWLFGKGRNDYRSKQPAVAQNIETRLRSFLGDCFFDTTAGIDWFTLLGGKNQFAVNLAVSTTILNTADVTGLLQLSVTLSASRNLKITYKVDTNFGVVTSSKIVSPMDLLTEDGQTIDTEGGDPITTEGGVLP